MNKKDKEKLKIDSKIKELYLTTKSFSVDDDSTKKINNINTLLFNYSPESHFHLVELVIRSYRLKDDLFPMKFVITQFFLITIHINLWLKDDYYLYSNANLLEEFRDCLIEIIECENNIFYEDDLKHLHAITNIIDKFLGDRSTFIFDSSICFSRGNLSENDEEFFRLNKISEDLLKNYYKDLCVGLFPLLASNEFSNEFGYNIYESKDIYFDGQQWIGFLTNMEEVNGEVLVEFPLSFVKRERGFDILNLRDQILFLQIIITHFREIIKTSDVNLKFF